MKTRLVVFGQRVAAAVLVSLPAAAVVGQEPAQPAASAPTRTAPQSVRDVEIYYGTRKVSPAPLPAATQPHIPVAPHQSMAEPPRTIERIIEKAPAAAVREPLAITVNAYSLPAKSTEAVPPSAPWLGENGAVVLPAVGYTQPANAAVTATPGQNAPPTIVVIREQANGGHQPAAPAAQTPPPEKGVGLETLLGIGIGLLGAGFGFASWRRRTPTVVKYPPAPPAVAPDGSVLLMGKYNAGPPREPAERFEIGPSYQAVALEKKKIEQQNEQAVLEFILSQNLALQGEMRGHEDLPDAIEFAPEATGDGPRPETH